ncbi:MAG: Gfo/Idh/MocA family oxidoreductase [Deltaproteobacteria bacterium]|nr:Gfo/Idh/MocA family oxidoreductase [Deltaproteobacteria bacterium]
MSSSEKIRAGVVGVGHLGSFHAEKYGLLDNVDLVGVFDMDGERAQTVARQLQVPAFTSLDTLLKRCQAVSIATPTISHFDIARRALELGLDILVEKPVTETPQQARELTVLAAAGKAVFQVGLLERFNPAYTATREYLDNPRFIEIHRLSPFSFRSVDIDVILDLMIHDLDLLHDLIKAPITSIAAVGVPVISDKIDIANVRINFSNGAVANLTASRVSLNRERRFRIFQPDGYFSIDFGNFSTTICRRESGSYLEPLPKIIADEQKFPQSDNLRLEIEDFIESVRQRRPPRVTGEDGLKALETAFAIKEAIAAQNNN